MKTCPNRYILNKKINVISLLSNGFEKRQGTYHIKKFIYKQIYIEIEIDLSEKWMTYFVKVNGLDEYYLPFYLEEQRINNIYCEKVINNFNRYMDKLSKQDILYKKTRTR